MFAASNRRLWKGGRRLDHLSLVQYHETTDPKSPAIELFSSSGSLQAFYAEFGWVRCDRRESFSAEFELPQKLRER
jgi:YidC periplasmic domain